ncbi:MAG: hypothetical protein P1U81_16915 [Verrucomicrobiales bacterium]|nr:hypothetical protein [Verrucomicrobiales bacterium]
MKFLSPLVLSFFLTGFAFAEDSFGELIFEDDFERSESQERKDEPGNEWTTSSEMTAGGQKQVDLRDGAMYMHTAEGANHAVSVRHEFAFENGTVGMRFKLENEGDTLRLNFADLGLKSVHAGHLFDAVIGLDQVVFEDKKTGVMNLEIRAAREAGTLTPEKANLLKAKTKSFPNPIEKGVWHDLLVHVDGDQISAEINGVKVGSFQSEGFAHPTKRLLRLLTPRHSAVDEVRIWRR